MDSAGTLDRATVVWALRRQVSGRAVPRVRRFGRGRHLARLIEASSRFGWTNGNDARGPQTSELLRRSGPSRRGRHSANHAACRPGRGAAGVASASLGAELAKDAATVGLDPLLG